MSTLLTGPIIKYTVFFALVLSFAVLVLVLTLPALSSFAGSTASSRFFRVRVRVPLH